MKVVGKPDYKKVMTKQIKSDLAYCQINVVSGLFAGIDIWELSVVPFLLNNNSVWAKMPKGAHDPLEDLHRTVTEINLPSPFKSLKLTWK